VALSDPFDSVTFIPSRELSVRLDLALSCAKLNVILSEYVEELSSEILDCASLVELGKLVDHDDRSAGTHHCILNDIITEVGRCYVDAAIMNK
jgi:hypothetical protein